MNESIRNKISSLLVVALLAGLLQSASGVGLDKAYAAGDALEGLHWMAKPSKSTDSTDSFRTAVYGNGKVIAAGTPPMPWKGSNAGDMHSGSLYRSSTDGAEWSVLDTGRNHELRGLTYGTDGFIGVGYAQRVMYGQQSYHGAIMQSNDGVSWRHIAPPNDTGTQLFGVTGGSAGYVAVGALSDINFAQSPVILYSSNGVNWSSHNPAGNVALNAVAFGEGTYVAVGGGGLIMTSSDGRNWTPQTSGISSTLRGIVYGNGKFIAVGSGSAILISEDGIAWTAVTPPVNGTFQSAAYGNGTYVIVGNGGNILSSSDGVNWTSRVSGTTAVLYGAAYVNGGFMALGANGTILMAQHKLEYVAGANGAISGEAAQGVAPGGSGKAVTAVPNVGYHFTAWSDGNTNPTRTDAGITGDLSVTAQFEINMYDLIYSAGPNGSVTGNLAQSVAHGDSGTEVTAVPDADYHFAGWSDGYAGAVRTDLVVTGPIAAQAIFAIDTYNLVYAASAGGTISGLASQTVNAGQDGQQVTAVPNTGYHFVQWSDGVVSPSRTERAVRASFQATAQFAINQYGLTYRAGSGGTVDGSASQTVDHGADGTAVTAVPNDGYQFTGWSDGITSLSRTDLDVTGAIDVTALFSIYEYTLTYAAGSGGTIDGDAAQLVDHGSDGVRVTAVPDEGYHFVSWSDGVIVPSRLDADVRGNINVTAQFAINQYTVDYLAGANGTITGNVSQTVEHGSDGTAVTAVPDFHYHFVKWSDGVTTAGRTDSNIKGVVSVTAQFAIDTFTLTYSGGTGGRIAGTASQTIEYGKDGAEVTAVPEAGYHFKNWSDGVTTASRTEGAVTADVQVTAVFERNQYTLSYQADANGTLNGNASQTVFHGEDGTEVKAVPGSGYQFVRWSDGVTSEARTDKAVSRNLNVTAIFAPIYTGGGGGGTSPDPDFTVIIDGKPLALGKANVVSRGGQSLLKVTLDYEKLKAAITGGEEATIVIPSIKGTDATVAELSGDIMRLMIQNKAVIQIERENAIYPVSANAIDLQKYAALFGKDIEAGSLTFAVEAGDAAADEAARAEQSANQRNIQLIAKPISFVITATHGGRTIELPGFSSYVERWLLLPDGSEGEMTTVVVFEKDGSIRHVPTRVESKNGKAYAVASSITNSLYGAVSRSAVFSDMKGHWAEEPVGRMASRLVLEGGANGSFSPNKAISRAQFAAIIVRALGLKLESGSAGFSDVDKSAWYADVVYTASKSGLITGYEDGSFRPEASITREQAMVIVAKAMDRLSINTEMTPEEIDSIVKPYRDGASVSKWAKTAVAANLKAGMVNGRSAEALDPKAFVSRAEVAVIAERLLGKAGLISIKG
ncbi:S-layer homology domain-containing protein [Paenibacillus sp. GCM10027627]